MIQAPPPLRSLSVSHISNVFLNGHIVSMPHERKIEELNWPPRNDNSYIPGTTTTTTGLFLN